MNRSGVSLESELRLPPEVIIVALMVLGFVLTLVGDSQPDMSVWFGMRNLALLLYALSAGAWLLVGWRPLAAKWFTIVGLTTVVYLGAGWLGVPELVTLMVMPTAVAAALISFRGALFTALMGTVLLVLPVSFPSASGPGTVVTALAATWSVVGALYAVHRQECHLRRWVHEYYERAWHLLDEAQDRQVELAETMEGLRYANRQLALATDRMAVLRTVAEEARRAKTAFVANVSHEFRTPLNMIVGLVDLILQAPDIYTVVLPPEMREDLEIIHRNCEHLSNMIDDVLDLTRMDTGRLTLHRERCSLEEIIAGSTEVVRPLLQKKHLHLRVSVPGDLPEIYCDRTRTQQALLNLMSNAARFTDEGQIAVQVTQRDQHVVVSVADTGPGIPPEDVERVFEPFCQGRGGLWQDKGGSGLGLSISRRFVELHGGRMWLDSGLGVGTTVTFELPISPPIEHIARPGHQMREDWVWREPAFRAARIASSDQLVRPRIIVYDETGGLCTEFRHYSDKVEFVDAGDLAQIGHELQSAPAHAVVLNVSSADALYSLAETVRQDVPNTPIIGCSVPQSLERVRDAGALGYLTKPVIRTDLERVLQTVGENVQRVLVVDDDPDVGRLFGRVLRACDSSLEVTTAASGEQALDLMRRSSPDLVLLDVVMQGMDGWQVLALMGKDEKMRRVPVFLVSAKDLVDQPPESSILQVTVSEGLSLDKLLRCSLQISEMLLNPEARAEPRPA